MDALRYFQSCKFASSLVDSGREAWQGRIGLRGQILPLKRPSCVCGEEGEGKRDRRGYMCTCEVGRERRLCECVCERMCLEERRGTNHDHKGSFTTLVKPGVN